MHFLCKEQTERNPLHKKESFTTVCPPSSSTNRIPVRSSPTKGSVRSRFFSLFTCPTPLKKDNVGCCLSFLSVVSLKFGVSIPLSFSTLSLFKTALRCKLQPLQFTSNASSFCRCRVIPERYVPFRGRFSGTLCTGTHRSAKKFAMWWGCGRRAATSMEGP